MPTIESGQLKRMTFDVFRKVGASDTVARVVSDYVVDSNLYGHDSHGCVAIPRFVNDVRIGKILPEAKPEIIRRDGSTALMDGRRSFGHFSAHAGVQLANELGQQHGVAAVGITNCNHVGMLWGWAKMVVDAGMIGLIMCSAGPRGGSMVPFGGTRPALAANPIAFAVPGNTMAPLISDFSTSVAAGGKVLLALQNDQQVPEGWILDQRGQPTTNPRDFITPDLQLLGAMLPFGGHKGYALALFAEVIGAVLTGYGCAYRSDYIEGNGTFIVAIDIARFVDVDGFRRQVDDLFRHVKSIPCNDGTDEVLIPGEIELRTRRQRERDGIPIPDGTWQTIADTARDLGVAIPP